MRHNRTGSALKILVGHALAGQTAGKQTWLTANVLVRSISIFMALYISCSAKDLALRVE